jgi:hypothetical protein
MDVERWARRRAVPAPDRKHVPFPIGHRDDAVRRDLDGARGAWLMIVCTSTAVSCALVTAGRSSTPTANQGTA